MIYAAFVALGAALGLTATRLTGPADAAGTPPTVRRAALVGAVLGAFLFELPADLFGWAPPVASGPHLGGRTVLGGLLGGWAAVEWKKRGVGHHAPTGDAFALGLPLSLAVARLGCVFTGCCPGVPIDPTSRWAQVSLALHHGPRFPATLLEAYFHLAAAALVLALSRTGKASGLRLLGYFVGYGIVRFGLEELRDVPHPFGGLSYYQLLAAALTVAAAATMWNRAMGRRAWGFP